MKKEPKVSDAIVAKELGWRRTATKMRWNNMPPYRQSKGWISPQGHITMSPPRFTTDFNVLSAELIRQKRAYKLVFGLPGNRPAFGGWAQVMTHTCAVGDHVGHATTAAMALAIGTVVHLRDK
jgi:hypothetical protein